MPFARPTLAELRAQVAADVASRLGLSALLPRSRLLALANAEAGAIHMLHGHLVHLAAEMFPQTSSAEGLARWAELANVQRKVATYAAGLLAFSGQPLAEVPQGTTLARADGQIYSTTAAGALDATGNAELEVAAEAAGALGNSAVGTSFQLSASLPGISATAIAVAPGLEGGVDAEDDEALRARVLEAFRAPVLGGAAQDYVTWALEVPGITRAWCAPLVMGPGTVGLAVVVDDAPYGPIPTEDDLDLVRAHVEPHRPVTAQLFIYGPEPAPLVLTLSVTPDTPAVRAALEASVKDLLRREAEPGGTILLSHIQEALSLADGEFDHVLLDPTANVEPGPGALVTFGSISYA